MSLRLLPTALVAFALTLCLLPAPALAQHPPMGPDEGEGPFEGMGPGGPGGPGGWDEGDGERPGPRPGQPFPGRGKGPHPFKGPSPDGMDDRGGMVDKAELERVLTFLKEWEPQRAKKVEAVLSERPFEGKMILRAVQREMQELEQIKQKDPEQYQKLLKRRQLESRTEELGAQLRKTTDPAQRTELEKQLRAALEELFPLRCLELEKKIELVSKDLERLKAALEQKKKNKDEVISRRFKKLSGQMDYLDW